MKKKIEDLFTEPTTKGITYITRPGSQWVNKGVNMIDESFPVQIDIELNTTCNLKCKMCFQKDHAPPRKNMSLALAYSLLNQAKKGGAESVKLQYRGEPMMYPFFVHVLRVAKKLGLYVHFNTNGTLLDKRLIETLIKFKVDKIIFSVDGATEKTYEKIRVGAKFQKIQENIMDLYAWKQLRDSKYPMIAIHGIVNDINREEMEGGLFEKMWRPFAQEIAYMEEFDLIDGSIDATPLPDWHCGQLWQRLFILVDGGVLPCCSGIDFENDIFYSVGDVNHQTLKEIWNSRAMDKLRERHRAGNSHLIEMCQKCRLRKNVVKKVKNND